MNKKLTTNDLKQLIDFRTLVSYTHTINPEGFIHCPSPDHEDKNPSCLVNDDYAYCFSCGWSGDHIGFLIAAYGISMGKLLRCFYS